MKKIWLTQGQFALVDDADYEWLNQWAWHAQYSSHIDSYYAVRKITLSNGKQRTVRMHREILGLVHGDKRQADHIHHDTLNNQRYELRIVTNRQNTSNKEFKGTSKYAGVSAYGDKWHSRIRTNKKQIHLGYYDTEIEAHYAYQAALKKLEETRYVYA